MSKQIGRIEIKIISNESDMDVAFIADMIINDKQYKAESYVSKKELENSSDSLRKSLYDIIDKILNNRDFTRAFYPNRDRVNIRYTDRATFLGATEAIIAFGEAVTGLSSNAKIELEAMEKTKEPKTNKDILKQNNKSRVSEIEIMKED